MLLSMRCLGGLHAHRALSSSQQYSIKLPVTRQSWGALAPSRRLQHSTPAPVPVAAPQARRHVAAAAVAEEYEVIKETLPNAGLKLTITVPGPTVQRCFQEAVEIMRTDVVGDLKGFRKDKVPLAMIIQRVGGQNKFKAAVVEHILLKAMPEVMSVHGARAVPNSERIVSDARALTASFDPAKPLTFEVSYEQLPPVEWSRPYSGIEISVDDTGTLATDTAAADDLIRQYLKEKGEQRVVAGRGLQQGDVSIIGMCITPVGSKDPFPGLNKDMFVFDTEADPLGMAPHMIGMVPGDERSWEFTFADDWHVELWRGMRASAKVKLQELFSWALPEFDDAFVAKHYPSFDSAQDMRNSLIATTSMQRLKDMDQRVQDRLMEEVVSRVAVEVPEALIMEVAAKEYQQRLMEMMDKNLAKPEDLDRLATQEMLQDFVNNTRADLIERCKYLLASDAIFEAEGLEVNNDDVQAEVERAREQFIADQMEFDETMLRIDTQEKFKYLQVMAWLQENAKVTIIPWVDDQPASGAAAATAAATAAA